METVKRASATTTLSLGIVEAEVKLYKATGKEEKAPSFVSAGPNGHPLRAEKRPVEASIEEIDPTDPFGVEEDETVVPPASAVEDPGPEDGPPPVAPASSSAPGEFKTVMVEEETGVEVEPADVRRGIRRDDGDFVDLTRQLEAIDEQAKLDRLQVLDFIRRERIPRERIVGSYYLAAAAEGRPLRILRLLYEVMRRTERVAIVRWSKVKEQSLGILVPHPAGALVVLQVAFADAARKPNSICLAHMKAAVTDKQLERMVELVESMSSPLSALDDYFDRRAQLQRELAEKAVAGEGLEEFAIVERPADEIERFDELLERAVAG